MTDRWTRAEERYRAREADRRYPRRDDWGLDARAARDDEPRQAGPAGWDDEAGTDVIPRYEDEIYDEPEPEPEPEPAPPPRRVGQRAAQSGRAAAPERGRARPAGRGKRSRIASRKAAERKRRRRNLWAVAAVFVVLVVSAAGFAGYKLMGSLSPAED
ncbi:endolytic transglycosylase MltG, partial [Nocardia salmonicida]